MPPESAPEKQKPSPSSPDDLAAKLQTDAQHSEKNARSSTPIPEEFGPPPFIHGIKVDPESGQIVVTYDSGPVAMNLAKMPFEEMKLILAAEQYGCSRAEQLFGPDVSIKERVAMQNESIENPRVFNACARIVQDAGDLQTAFARCADTTTVEILSGTDIHLADGRKLSLVEYMDNLGNINRLKEGDNSLLANNSRYLEWAMKLLAGSGKYEELRHLANFYESSAYFNKDNITLTDSTVQAQYLTLQDLLNPETLRRLSVALGTPAQTTNIHNAQAEHAKEIKQTAYTEQPEHKEPTEVPGHSPAQTEVSLAPTPDTVAQTELGEQTGKDGNAPSFRAAEILDDSMVSSITTTEFKHYCEGLSPDDKKKINLTLEERFAKIGSIRSRNVREALMHEKATKLRSALLPEQMNEIKFDELLKVVGE